MVKKYKSSRTFYTVGRISILKSNLSAEGLNGGHLPALVPTLPPTPQQGPRHPVKQISLTRSVLTHDDERRGKVC